MLLMRLLRGIWNLRKLIPGEVSLWKLVVFGGPILFLLITLHRGYLMTKSLVLALEHGIDLARTIITLPDFFLAAGVGSCLCWFMWGCVLNRRLQVAAGEAKIVVRLSGGVTELFQGQYQLRLGDYVKASYPLCSIHHQGNEEVLVSGDGQPLRVRGDFLYRIVQPLAYHTHGRKLTRCLAAIARDVLLEEIKKLSADELWNCPVEVNRAIATNLNNKLRRYGVTVGDYRLETIVLPLAAVRWQRDATPEYWQEAPL